MTTPYHVIVWYGVVNIKSCFHTYHACIRTRHRIEGLFPQEQEILENKAWLNEYLNAVASICFTDLQSVKDKGVRCFPPSYEIMNFYVKQYHKNLVKVVS